MNHSRQGIQPVGAAERFVMAAGARLIDKYGTKVHLPLPYCL